MRRPFTIYSAFLDIKNSICWYQEIHFLVSRKVYHFLISRNRILDIKICMFWYQELDFLISRNRILDIKKYLLFLDIKKSISWYQKIFLDIKKYFLISKIHFLISRNRILDIKKCWINSKTAPHTPHLQKACNDVFFSMLFESVSECVPS